MEDRVREFDVSSATVELAAQALGVEGARIAKTLSFKLPEEKPILILAAGDARIDNHKYKEKFHVKCFLASVEYRSATDLKRFEQCIALRGDGFYAKYTGLQEL